MQECMWECVIESLGWKTPDLRSLKKMMYDKSIMSAMCEEK